MTFGQGSAWIWDSGLGAKVKVGKNYQRRPLPGMGMSLPPHWWLVQKTRNPKTGSPFWGHAHTVRAKGQVPLNGCERPHVHRTGKGAGAGRGKGSAMGEGTGTASSGAFQSIALCQSVPLTWFIVIITCFMYI